MSKEIHIVKRAIIMAAGKGNRLHPLTLEIPKPLIKVNGVSMIDTVINALKSNGINEIYVVVGYLKEQFYNWAKNQKNVKIIENPYYESCNNISSLYMAREYLEDCMILDGDQVINNYEALSPYFTNSGYNAVWCSEKTNEWLMQVENGVVKSCSRTGGTEGWQLFSVSRWSSEDGILLRKQLEFEFENGNRQIFWDDVPMFCYFNYYKLGIHEMNMNDVIEIDNISELLSIDNSYASVIER